MWIRVEVGRKKHVGEGGDVEFQLGLNVKGWRRILVFLMERIMLLSSLRVEPNWWEAVRKWQIYRLSFKWMCNDDLSPLQLIQSKIIYQIGVNACLCVWLLLWDLWVLPMSLIGDKCNVVCMVKFKWELSGWIRCLTREFNWILDLELESKLVFIDFGLM